MKPYKTLLLVENDSKSDKSIDKISLYALLLVMRQDNVICVLKLFSLKSRLGRQSGVPNLVIKKHSVMDTPYSCIQ